MTAAKKLAREYELIYVLRSAGGPSEAKKVSDRIVEVLDKQGARLTRVDQWGVRKLAYPIKKQKRGRFIYITFVGFSDVVAELERNLRNLDSVIRFQTVRLEGLFDLEQVQVDAEEIEFHEIEADLDEDDEPSFEERLGMKRREPPPPPEAEAPAAEGAEGAEGATAEAGAEGATAEASAEGAPEGDAAAAPAEAAPAAEAATETSQEAG